MALDWRGGEHQAGKVRKQQEGAWNTRLDSVVSLGWTTSCVSWAIQVLPSWHSSPLLAVEQSPEMAFEADEVTSERRKRLYFNIRLYRMTALTASVLQLFRSFSFDLRLCKYSTNTLPLFCTAWCCAAFPSFVWSFLWDCYETNFVSCRRCKICILNECVPEVVFFCLCFFFSFHSLWCFYKYCSCGKTERYSPEFTPWLSLWTLFTFFTLQTLDLSKK